MTERIANRITRELVENQMIQPEAQEFYQYSLLVLIEKIIGVTAILLLALWFRLLPQTIVFIFFFFRIRNRSGGFHLNTFGGCFVGTLAVYVIYALWLYPLLLEHPMVNYGMLVIAAVLILVLGAVNHPNMEWSKEEFLVSRRMARFTVLLELLCIGVFVFLQGDESYILFMSYGVILSAILLVLGKIIKQEVTS